MTLEELKQSKYYDNIVYLANMTCKDRESANKAIIMISEQIVEFAGSDARNLFYEYLAIRFNDVCSPSDQEVEDDPHYLHCQLTLLSQIIWLNITPYASPYFKRYDFAAPLDLLRKLWYERSSK